MLQSRFRRLTTAAGVIFMLVMTAMLGPGLASASAVVGGSEATSAEYPYVADVAFYDHQGKHVTKYSCSASLIGRWLLTAAHCAVDPATGTIVAPDHFVVTFGTGSQIETVPVSQVEVYPTYPLTSPDPTLDHAQVYPGDFALLKLATPVSKPAIGLVATEPAAGQAVTFVGFGCTAVDANKCQGPSSNLHAATSTIMPDAVCELGDQYAIFDICTAGPDRTSTVRPGDSGGPMLVATPRGNLLAGVISAGNEAHDLSGSTAAILPWIQAVTGITPVSYTTALPPVVPAAAPTNQSHQVACEADCSQPATSGNQLFAWAGVVLLGLLGLGLVISI